MKNLHLLFIIITLLYSTVAIIYTLAAGVPGKAFHPFLSPSGREDFGFAAVSSDSGNNAVSLYVVGGQSNMGLESDVWRYDLTKRVWEKQLSESFDSNQIAFTLHALDTGDGTIELLAASGKEFSSNSPTDQVQAYSGNSWSTVDAHAASGGVAKSSRAYWSASWYSVDQLGTDSVDIWLTDGVDQQGFDRNTYRISLNRTRGAKSASWQEPLIQKNVGPRLPVFGSCCARDPTRPLQRRAVCFGGSNFVNDTNEVVYVKYASGPPFFEQKSGATGPAPFPRRQASCAFVAQDKFVVWGGFDSYRGGAINDDKSYILDVSTPTPSWSIVNNFNLRPAYNAKMTTCLFANGSTQTFLFGGNLGDNEYNSYLYRWHGSAGVGFVPETHAQPTSAVDGIPAGRAFHNAVELKSSIILFNGIDENDKALNDIWQYETTTKQWFLLSFYLTGTWTARFLSQAKVISSVITFYGGFTDTSFILTAKDLIEVDTSTGTVRTTSDVGNVNAPGGRAAFGNFIQNKIFVVSGGKGDLYQTKSTWHGYNTLTQSWSPLYLEGNKTLHAQNSKAFTRYAHIAEAFNDTHAVVGLGFGKNSFFDLYWVHNISTEHERFDMTPISTTVLVNGTRRDFIRGFAAVMISGNFLFVCGGQSSFTMAPPKRSACFGVDLGGEVWFTLGDSETNEFQFSGHVMSYIGKTLYITGGYKSNDISFTKNTHQDVIKFVFDKSAICGPGVASSQFSGCMLCSKGTVVNPLDGDCYFASAGKYVKDPVVGEQNCSVGKAQSAYGARESTECTVCPLQTYAPMEGLSNCLPCPDDSYCPVGASSALSLNSPRALLLSNVPPPTESHPVAFSSLPIPWFPIIIIVSAIALVGITSIVIGITGWYSRRKRARYYLTQELEEVIEGLYETYARSMFGMSEFDLLNCLIAERNALIPNHDIDADSCHRLFATVDRYNQHFFTDAAQLRDCFILAISTGYMQPFPDTPAVKDPKLDLGTTLTYLSGIDLATIDYFDDQHQMAGNGDSNIMVKNWQGGAVTIVMILLMIGLVMMVILDFLLNNILESKQAVPRAVIYSIFESQGMQVSTPIIAKITVFGLLRSNQGVNDLRDGCVKLNTQKECASATASPLGILSPRPGTSLPTSLECSFDTIEEACTVTWRCDDCYVTESDDGGNVTFTVSPAYASPLIKAQIEVGTGLRAATQGNLGQVEIAGGPLQFSTSTSYVAPSSNQTVFSGFPASTWSFALTNTYFEAQDHASLVGGENTYLATGYHIRELALPAQGSTVTPEFFDKKFDVPVTLTFTVDATPVLVKRAYLQSLVDLLSSLLGTVSGAMGIFVLGLNWIDQWGVNDNFDEEEGSRLTDRLEDNNNNSKDNNNQNSKYHNNNNGQAGDFTHVENASGGQQEMTTLTKSPSSQQRNHPINNVNYAQLQKLLTTGMPLPQAEAVIKCIDLAINPSFAEPLPTSSNPDLAVVSTNNATTSAVDDQQQQVMLMSNNNVAGIQNNNNNNNTTSGHYAPKLVHVKSADDDHRENNNNNNNNNSKVSVNAFTRSNYSV